MDEWGSTLELFCLCVCFHLSVVVLLFLLNNLLIYVYIFISKISNWFSLISIHSQFISTYFVFIISCLCRCHSLSFKVLPLRISNTLIFRSSLALYVPPHLPQRIRSARAAVDVTEGDQFSEVTD